MQNAKSYEDLKAELGNPQDWGQITAVSMRQVAGPCGGPLTVIGPVGTEKAPAFSSSPLPPSSHGSSCCFTLVTLAVSSSPFPSEMVPKFYHA